MKSTILLFGLFITLNFSCSNDKNESSGKNRLIGTWQLISSEARVNDTITNENMNGKKMIKIITESHFAFLNHDLNGGKDSSALFVSGGGTCKFSDSIYSENLEYCNYREWEGLKVDFKVQFSADTLVLSGSEKKDDIKVNQYIKEKYIKIGD